MDLTTHEYEVDVDGQRVVVRVCSLGQALRKLGDAHWDETEIITIRGSKSK